MDPFSYRVMFKHLCIGSFFALLPKVPLSRMSFYSPLHIHPSSHSELSPFFYTYGRIESQNWKRPTSGSIVHLLCKF